MRLSGKTIVTLALAVALFATALVYLPGMSGGYVFDDYPNIVDNTQIHVTHSTLAAWANAAWSSPSSAFKRPLASLTFAANWFFSGYDPAPMKVTNLLIHLLNGLLLFCMLRELLRAWNTRCGDAVVDEAAAQRLALVVTAGWLLLPVNLMAVLYVVQRMESLCQVFVLAGLWAYLCGRRRMLAASHAGEKRGGLALATAGLVLGTFLGLLSKESAVLLPAYAFLAEAALLRFHDARGVRDRRIGWLFVCLLFVPMVLGLVWLLPRVLAHVAWDGRTFTLSQRLLTEPRILVDYLRWTLFPDPISLSLYHDQIVTSTGLLAPWTTLAAIVFLLALLVLAWLVRNRLPLVALGIAWFFAAQLLTATVIPLELVYEHRNYFASIGVLLAVYSLLLGLRRTITLPIVRGALAAVLLVWFGGVTFLRAQDWSDPLRLALAEANRHPDSPRANYEAGRLLIIASGYLPSPALERSRFYLQRAAAIPSSSTLPEQAQIMVDNHLDKPEADTQVWAGMTAKLRAHPISEEDVSALISLTQCRDKNDCRFDTAQLQRAFMAALSHPHPISRLLGAYADFARDLLHDDALAMDYLQRAVDGSPGEPAYRIELAHLEAIHGETGEAVRNIDALRRMDSFGRLDSQIAILERQAELGGPPVRARETGR